MQGLVLQYLQSDDTKRQSLQNQNPDIFTAEVIEELEAAEMLMKGAETAANDAYTAYDELADEIELPPESKTSEAAIPDPSKYFALVLQELLEAQSNNSGGPMSST